MYIIYNIYTIYLAPTSNTGKFVCIYLPIPLATAQSFSP